MCTSYFAWLFLFFSFLKYYHKMSLSTKVHQPILSSNLVMQEKYLILIYLRYILYLEKLGKNSQSECLILWQDTNNMSD